MKERCERGGAGNRYPMLRPQLIDKTRPSNDLGKESLRGEKKDRKIGRVRRTNVFLADVLRVISNATFKCFSRFLNSLRVSAFRCLREALIVLVRHFRINGYPDGFVACSGQF